MMPERKRQMQGKFLFFYEQQEAPEALPAPTHKSGKEH
jgi:hypothetical protein